MSLDCAQDGRESCPAAVPHMVAGKDLTERKRSKQSIACVPVCCVSHLRWPSCLTTGEAHPLQVQCWEIDSVLMKKASVIAQAPQNPSRQLRTLTPPHFQQRHHVVENDCEISFPFMPALSVPRWQHERIGKWKLSLRKTLYRKRTFICLCLIVPWTLLEKMVALCQRICQTVLWHGPQWRCYEHGVLWLPSAWNTLNLHRVCS